MFWVFSAPTNVEDFVVAAASRVHTKAAAALSRRRRRGQQPTTIHQYADVLRVDRITTDSFSGCLLLCMSTARLFSLVSF